MRTWSRQSLILALGAVLSLAVGLGSAHAGFPALTIDWWVNGVFAGHLTPIGADPDGNGTWGYSGFASGPGQTGVLLNYNLNGNPDPLISGNLVVQNPNLALAEVVMIVTLPIGGSYGPQTTLAGSAAIGFTSNSNGGTFSSIGGDPVWQGMLDGVAVGPSASLFFDPFQIVHSGSQSTGASGNFGLNGPPVLDGPVSQSIGIRIAFSITQTDQASITSVFNVVPGPAGLAVLACGIFATRRRRCA